jgi:hypothetical protein
MTDLSRAGSNYCQALCEVCLTLSADSLTISFRFTSLIFKQLKQAFDCLQVFDCF